MNDYPISREYEELDRRDAYEAADVCEWCGAPDGEHDHEQLARYCLPAQLDVHRKRLCELISIMEFDMAWGSVTAGETRKLILADARKLVPDMPPPKTLNDILRPEQEQNLSGSKNQSVVAIDSK